MRPCAAPGLRGHTAWLGGVAAWVRRVFFPWVQSRRALAHLFASPAGDSAIRRPRRSGCARLCALRARTARIRLRDGRGCWWRVSTQSASPHRSPVGRGRGRGCRITRLGRHGARALVVHALRRRRAACWQSSGAKAAGVAVPRGATPGANLGGARCMPRGRGRRPRAVARSQTCEDHTTTPRWRARARIVLSRRGQLVSRFGQKKEKSTTCEPSTLRRSVGSRPTRGSHRRKKNHYPIIN